MAAAASSIAPTPTVPRPDSPRAGLVRDTGAVRRDSVRATRWIASGAVKVLGNVDIDQGSVAGLISVAGRLSASSLSVRGTLEVDGTGDVRGSFSGVGTLRFAGAFHAVSASVRGHVLASAELRVDRDLRVTGLLEATAVTAGLIDLVGAASVPGDLAAIGSITGRFKGDSNLGRLRARSIVLRGPPGGFVPKLLRKVFGGNATVRAERLEAETVELESVDVGFVRAKSIALGPDAHVAELEGTIVRRHPSARVGPESRSPPPYGLSR